MSVRLDSHNYLKVGPITKLTAEGLVTPDAITSVTAELYKEDRKTAVPGSIISLRAVTDQADTYEGTFGHSLDIDVLGPLWVKVTIQADALTAVIWEETRTIMTNT